MTMMAVVINNGVEVDDECDHTEEEERVVKNDKDKILTMFSATTILAEMLAKRQAQRRGT